MTKRQAADPSTELARDIAAARAELRGRCDQLVAEYEERMQALAAVQQQVESGQLDVKSAQTRIRQLLHERGPVGGLARAGRTTIGLSVPTAKPTAAPPPQRMAPSSTVAEAGATRVLQVIDGRLASLLAKPRPASARAEARLELSLMTTLRKGIEAHLRDVPEDPVLVGLVMDALEDSQTILTDLEAGGGARLGRLVDFVRTLAGQLSALGIGDEHLKPQLQRLRTLASGSDAEQNTATADVVAVWLRLQQELDKRYPAASSSLLDELTRLT